VNCRSLILYVLISELISHKTAYSDSSKFFLLLVCSLQEINTLVQAWKTKEAKKKHSCDTEYLRWAFHSIELLCYNERVYISFETSVKTEILKHHYDDELMSHFNIEWTQELVSHKYYWLKLTENIKKYVFSCDIYQHVKMSRHWLYNEMQLLLCSNDFWKEIIMNMITDLSSCKWDNSVYNAILMIVNCYIKMTKYISMSKTLIAVELANIFFEKIVCWYDIFKEIVSDRDSIFINNYWSEICYQMKIKCRLSIIFYF